MNKLVILTNNPTVLKYLEKNSLNTAFQLTWIDGFTEDVLRSARDYCHKNHKLLTHPLTGSIKPNQTPFKTVVLETLPGNTLWDLASIHLAEASLQKTLALLQSSPRVVIKNHESDFALIDLDFFCSYLHSTSFN